MDYRCILLFILTHLFLSFFLSLSYFILAVPMRKWLGKHSCMNSSFPIVILNDTCFFSDSATTSAQKRIRCEVATLANALVTLCQRNYYYNYAMCADNADFCTKIIRLFSNFEQCYFLLTCNIVI